VDEGDPLPAGTGGQISVLGIAKNMAVCPTTFTTTTGICEDGTYRIEAAPSAGQTPADIPSLLASGSYLFKVTAQDHYPTYQIVRTGSSTAATGRKDLLMFSTEYMQRLQNQASVTQSAGKGILTGTVFDLNNGRPAEGVSIEFRDTNSGLAGQVYYLDDRAGQVDPTRTFTSRNGRYIVFNATPGLLFVSVTSPDDTGNDIVRAFAGSVMLQDISVNSAIPPEIQVTGIAKTLKESVAGGITVTTLGGDVHFDQARLPVSFEETTAGDGSFAGLLSPYSDYAIKATGAGIIDTYNFNMPTLGRSIHGMEVIGITQQELQALAQSAGISLDSSKGVIIGQTLSADLDLPSSYDVSGAPQAVIGTFINLDADPDLAVLNRDTGEVVVFINNGDGTFYRSAAYPVGSLPSSFVAGDFNRDGIVDLAVANEGSSTLTILQGNRQGLFPKQPLNICIQVEGFSCKQGLAPVDLKIGDFNGDRLADLFVLNRDADTLSILLGNGQGDFFPLVQQSPYVVPIPLHPPEGVACRPRSIELYFLDSDLLIDWVVACDNLNSLIFLASRTGFKFGPLPPGYEIRGLAVGSLNTDTQLDIAVPMASQLPGIPGIVALVLSGGINRQVEVGMNPTSAELFDFNNDGLTDLIVTHEGSDPAGRPENCSDGIDNDADGWTDGRDADCPSVWVLLGRGDGTFESFIFFVGLEPQGGGPTSTFSGDFDGNRLNDLVISNRDTRNIFMVQSRDVPLGDVSVEAVGIEGNPIGLVHYLDPSSDTVQTDGVSTRITVTQSAIRGGRYIIFNAPPGLTRVRPTSGGSGSHLITVYPNAVSFIRHELLPITIPPVRVSGFTVDAVVRPVGEVDITFLNTPIRALSAPIVLDQTGLPVGANYGTFLEANSKFVIRLSRVGAGRGLPPEPGDLDFDSITDTLDDCPGIFNPDQTDTDGDNIGDACDPTPTG
jgi:hypothetical protein